MKPLLPEIANTDTFKHAADSQVREYASSTSVVTQLLDALDSWLSHSDQVINDLNSFIKNCDADCRAVEVADNLICDIATALKRLELETSFHAQFETRSVIAIRKVLSFVPDKSKEKLEKLDKNLEILKNENVKLARSRELFTLLDSFCARDSSWTLMNCDDTLPPLFCSLRAVFICCPLFGKYYPRRFSALIRCVLKKIETLIRTTLPKLLTVSALSSPAGMSGVDQAVAGCLAAQSACISVQEEFYKLRISVAEAVTREFTTVIYEGIDEETVFSRLDFFYDRCVIILQLLTVIKRRKNELFVSSGGFCQKILKLDLLSPDDEVITHEELIDAIRVINESPSMRPKDIIERIESRAAEHQETLKKKESAAILQAATEAATGRKHQSVLKQQQDRIREKEKQQQEELEQHKQLLKKGASFMHLDDQQKEEGENEKNDDNHESEKHQSRIADSNETANRDWSLHYGDQREQLALLSDRDPYYSVVFAFNPPRILILGIPLKQKQLEILAVRFQDALRSRVLHTADKIRQNRLAPAQITTSSHILKGHYEKFRSAAEELADARYEAHEKSFKKSTAQVQMAQIHSQMMSGFSSSNNSNNNKTTDSSAHHQSQLEIELMQLRRFHVAAAHNAYMLDLPSSTTVSDDDDTLQSYAIQAVLDTFEEFEKSNSGKNSKNKNPTSFGDSSYSPSLLTPAASMNDFASGASSPNSTFAGAASMSEFPSVGSNNNNKKSTTSSSDNELATTLAYTDSNGVFWSFFIFRYLPAMPKSKRERN